MSSCGAFCSFCGRCGRSVDKGFLPKAKPDVLPRDVPPPGASPPSVPPPSTLSSDVSACTEELWEVDMADRECNGPDVDVRSKGLPLQKSDSSEERPGKAGE